jgi:hypothetical protein
MEEGNTGGANAQSGCCPNCGSYQVRVVVDGDGREAPTRCGQCGWRREP